MPERFSVARRLLEVFAVDGGLPGLTLGDLEEKAGLRRGTATHQRITDLRAYEWDIRCSEPAGTDDMFRYHVLHRERLRMQRYLRTLAERGVRTAKIRGEGIAA